MRIEGDLAGLLERRVAEEQAVQIVQHGLLFLKMHQQWIGGGGGARILRCQVLEVLEVHQIHIGEAKDPGQIVQRGLDSHRGALCSAKGNVNGLIMVAGWLL